MICLLSGISSFAIRVFVLVLLIISDRVVAVFILFGEILVWNLYCALIVFILFEELLVC